MSEEFKQPEVSKPEVIPNEAVERLREVFMAVEEILMSQGRELAKPFLDRIYAEFKRLNKTLPEEQSFIWHQEGELTEEQFNELNLRRKLLSNAIGIMTASGVVRHDVNKI
ncbi:MAG: hypothetical protein Q7N87_04370 [Candidatus Uhrbacteria bacterium]|nr:hypothetical protein [Candidatus Uhrbacteria bacterium]MDP3794095.1 hypothetical protein [Candidatus Uhrbacteria bacterium]